MPENVKALLSNLNGGTLVLLSEGTDEQIKTFNDRVGEIDSEAYEAMASFVDESDTIKVFGKCEGDYVTELFIAFQTMKIVPYRRYRQDKQGRRHEAPEQRHAAADSLTVNRSLLRIFFSK